MVEPNTNPNPYLRAFPQLGAGQFCRWSFLPWQSYGRSDCFCWWNEPFFCVVETANCEHDHPH